MDGETNEFSAVCETGAELILVLHHLFGIEAVEKLLMASPGTRQSLRRDADQFAGVGLKALASLLRKYARKAKLGPPTFAEKWRIAERRSGALPGFVPNRGRRN
jgi:hypothetical protein